LVRSPTRKKLTAFLERLQDNNHHADGDPTSLWYFLTIHDSILHPLVEFLKFKTRKKAEEEAKGLSLCQRDQSKRSAVPYTSLQLDKHDASKRLKMAADEVIPT
jgi:hypothetical protein